MEVFCQGRACLENGTLGRGSGKKNGFQLPRCNPLFSLVETIGIEPTTYALRTLESIDPNKILASLTEFYNLLFQYIDCVTNALSTHRLFAEICPNLIFVLGIG
jgi:hypothetical protein